MAAFVLAAPSANAATEVGSTEKGISFDEALGWAAEHPQVVAPARALEEKRAMDARVSRLIANPQLSVQPGYRLAPSSERQPELLAELLQPFSVSGHARARREALTWEERALAARAQAAILEQRLWVADAWVLTWRAGRALEDAKGQYAVAGSLVALVTRAQSLGAATVADVADAEAFAAETELARVSAEGEACARGVELRRLVGRDGAGPLVATGDLPEPGLPPGAKLESALALLDRLPRVAQGRLLASAARARVVEEAAARGSSMAVGAVLQRDAPGGLVMSLAARFTPALWDRGERERGTLAAEARVDEGEAQGRVLEARAQLTLAFHEVEHSAEVLEVLEQRAGPSTSRAAESRRKLFEVGRATLPEVLWAERRRMAVAAQIRQARADHAWARVKLWLLLSALGSGGAS